MKNTWLKVLAAMLVVLAMLLVTVACNGGQETTSQTESQSESASASESATVKPPEKDTESESETEDPFDTAFCFIEDEDGEYYYYDSLEAAMEDFPDGTEIYVLDDFIATEPITFAEGTHFAIHFDGSKELKLDFTNGFLFEVIVSGTTSYVCYSDMEDMLTCVDGIGPHYRVFWVQHEMDGFEPGRYLLKNANWEDENLEPIFSWEKTHGIEMFGVPYIFAGNNDPKNGKFAQYFYSLEEAVSTEHLGNSCNLPILNPYDCPVEIEVPVGGVNQPGYRISYSWKLLTVKWSFGVTYDDDMSENNHGYCYYSCFSRICGVAGLDKTHMYIWSDMEGYRPGKYYMEYVTEDNRDVVKLDEEGNMIEGSMGLYHLTHVDEIWNFAPEWNDVWEANPGWKAEYPEWVAEHPNANLN